MKIKELLEGEVVQGNFTQNGKVIVSTRRDAGDEWKYWTGVNFFGTKSRAMKVPMSSVDKLLSDWGLKLDKPTRSGEARVEKI